METKKKNITDTLGFINSWLTRGLGVFTVTSLGYEFFKALNSSESIINPELIFIGILLAFIIFYAAKIFTDYSGITELYISDYGVHSKKDNVAWENISNVYLEKKLGIPILFIEFSNNDEEYVLKTALGHLEGKAKKTLNQVQSQWQLHQNT